LTSETASNIFQWLAIAKISLNVGLSEVSPKVFSFETDIKNFIVKVYSCTLRSEIADIKE